MSSAVARVKPELQKRGWFVQDDTIAEALQEIGESATAAQVARALADMNLRRKTEGELLSDVTHMTV